MLWVLWVCLLAVKRFRRLLCKVTTAQMVSLICLVGVSSSLSTCLILVRYRYGFLAYTSAVKCGSSQTIKSINQSNLTFREMLGCLILLKDSKGCYFYNAFFFVQTCKEYLKTSCKLQYTYTFSTSQCDHSVC